MTDAAKTDELLEAINNGKHNIVTTLGTSETIEAHHINSAIKKYNETPMRDFSIQRKTLEYLTTTANDSVLQQIEPSEDPTHGYKFVKAAIEQNATALTKNGSHAL